MGIAIYMLAFAFLLTGVYALVAKKNIVSAATPMNVKNHISTPYSAII